MFEHSNLAMTEVQSVVKNKFCSSCYVVLSPSLHSGLLNVWVTFAPYFKHVNGADILPHQMCTRWWSLVSYLECVNGADCLLDKVGSRLGHAVNA